MAKCIITDQEVSDYLYEETISYTLKINGYSYHLQFDISINWVERLLTDQKRILKCWLWNNDWPIENDTILTYDLILRTLRQAPYPQEFPQKLDYFIINFYQKGGRDYKTISANTSNYFIAFADDEEEYTRILSASLDHGWIKIVGTGGKDSQIQILPDGITYCLKKLDSIKQITKRNLEGRKIYILFTEEDKILGDKITRMVMDRGASVSSYHTGINQDWTTFGNALGSMLECDFALCLKTKNSDRNGNWRDLISRLALVEESINRSFFCVLMGDDSPYDDNYFLQMWNRLIFDFRIIPMQNYVFSKIEEILQNVKSLISNVHENVKEITKGDSDNDQIEINSNSDNIYDVSQIHEQVFNVLSDWSEKNEEIAINPYFHIRSKRDDRFKKGYWFPGDENYMAISFWTGGDAFNRTPNIYISLNYNKNIEVHLVARDSDNKRKYFETLANKLEGYIAQNTYDGYWKKMLSHQFDDYLEVIQEFISGDKQIIDQTLSETLKNGNPDELALLEDEFSSKFDFIARDQFYKHKTRVEEERARLLSSHVPNTLIKMPLSLKSIEIKRFYGIDHCTVLNLPNDSPWIFFTGENSFGKSSVLKGIAIGLTNYDENRDYLNQDSNIEIGYYDRGETVINSSTSAYIKGFRHINDKLIAYGPIRLNVQASSSEAQESKNSSNIYNIFHHDGLLKNVSTLLRQAKLTKNNTEFNNITSAIIKILDGHIEEIGEENGDIYYVEVDDQKRLLAKNKGENLATGYKGLINLVADIITRFSKKFSNKKYSEYEGIVIIDELENHLHPSFQRKLPTLLSELFPKIQFIASIHSPIPLLGAPVKSSIIKVVRNAEVGIKLENIIIDNIETLNPNILLTSPIFGFTSIISQNLANKKDLRTEDFYTEMLSDQELVKRYKNTFK